MCEGVTVSTSPQRLAYHHGDLRHALLDAAAGVAADLGSESLSLREVARRAGVTHTAVYNHFSDKNDLLRALAIRAFEDLSASLAESVSQTPSALEDIGAAYLRFAWEHTAVFRFMFQRSLCMPPGQFDPLQDAGLATQKVLVSEVLRLQAGGHLHFGDEERQALAIWSQVHGITTIVLETPAFKSVSRESAEAIVRESVRSLVEGLAARH